MTAAHARTFGDLTRRSAIVLGLLMTLASAQAIEPVPMGRGDSPAVPNLHLKNGRWFDGETFKVDHWYAVGGKLTRARPKRVDKIVDLSGRWIIPPLAEAHNHDLQNSYLAGRSASAYLRRGIFYSAQLCGNPADIAGAQKVMAGAPAPDVIYAAACISSSDGHPLGIALAGAKAAGEPVRPNEVRDKAYWSVDTLAQLDARWQAIAASRPALVKVILIDSRNYLANRARTELFGYNGIDPALVQQIVARAHQLRARVVAHTDTADDFARAVASGVDIIGHLPGYRIAPGKTIADYRLSDATIRAAAARRVAVITTTVASKHDIQRHPTHRDAIRSNYIDNIRRLRAAGVELLVGSDSVGGSVLDEIDSLDALGALPRAELLRAATMTTPRRLFPSRRIGGFAEGADASAMVLCMDPLSNLSALSRPTLLLKQGSLMKLDETRDQDHTRQRPS